MRGKDSGEREVIHTRTKGLHFNFLLLLDNVLNNPFRINQKRKKVNLYAYLRTYQIFSTIHTMKSYLVGFYHSKKQNKVNQKNSHEKELGLLYEESSYEKSVRLQLKMFRYFVGVIQIRLNLWRNSIFSFLRKHEMLSLS